MPTQEKFRTSDKTFLCAHTSVLKYPCIGGF